jgi:hypothetical protein
MMVFFPGQKLLYGSDAFQDIGTYQHPTQQVSELVEAVKRNHLAVARLFMTHIDPTPWADAVATLSKLGVVSMLRTRSSSLESENVTHEN